MPVSKRKPSNSTLKPWQDEEELSKDIEDDDDEEWINEMVNHMRATAASLREIKDLMKDFVSLAQEHSTPKKAKKEP